LDRTLIIGTRGSELALWQANFVKDRLAENNVAAELKIIKTQGDRILNLSFDKLEGKGFFTKELEEELLAGTIDLAVHSHKDLPTENPPGLIIAAVSEREDASELLLILKDCVDVRQKMSVMRPRVQVQQVSFLIDIHERDHVRPASGVARSHMSHSPFSMKRACFVVWYLAVAANHAPAMLISFRHIQKALYQSA